MPNAHFTTALPEVGKPKAHTVLDPVASLHPSRLALALVPNTRGSKQGSLTLGRRLLP